MVRWDERSDTPGASRYAGGVRGLAIAVVCLMGCSPNEFGQGSGGEPMTTGSESSSSSGVPATTTGGSSSTSVASTSTTAADGTSSSTSTDGSSSTTDPVLECGEAPPSPGSGCDDACTQCDAGLCLIDCGGGGSPPCASETITCPDDRPCQIECSGTDACREAHVVCPSEQPCSVACFGASCGSLVVTCGAGPCSLACNTSATACSYAEFQCGSNDGTITCNTTQSFPPSPVSSGSECSCASEGCQA